MRSRKKSNSTFSEKELAFQNQEKEKRAAELVVAIKELDFQHTEKEKRAAELVIANKELRYQNEEKEKRAKELVIANKELQFQNEEKEKRAAELVIANQELAFQNKEKEKRAAELIIANQELIFQNEQKEKRAAELIVANEELIFQNEEKEKRAAELIIANKELVFQNEEKEKRAAELIIANKELAFQNAEKEKRAAELIIAEKRAGDLFHLSPQPMWLYNPETYRFIQVNKAAIEHYGYSEEEFLNITLMDLSPNKDILATREAARLHEAENDEIYKGEFAHKKKSGEIIEVEIFSTPISINNFSYRSVIAIDITEKIQYEHKIIKAIIKTQEDERYEIGAELHDNVCQVLAASQLNLGMLRSSLAKTGTKMFEQCKGNISLALDEIRNLSHRLAPVFLGDTTMEEAFRRLFSTFIFDDKCKISLFIHPEVVKYDISQEIQLNLYRILQEQLRNILKYANADALEVEVIIYNDNLTMRISDNGIGFILNEVKNGIGLANMKRRAELFSGRFEVISSPGHGCVIIIDIPLLQANAIHMKKEYETVYLEQTKRNS